MSFDTTCATSTSRPTAPTSSSSAPVAELLRARCATAAAAGTPRATGPGRAAALGRLHRRRHPVLGRRHRRRRLRRRPPALAEQPAAAATRAGAGAVPRPGHRRARPAHRHPAGLEPGPQPARGRRRGPARHVDRASTSAWTPTTSATGEYLRPRLASSRWPAAPRSPSRTPGAAGPRLPRRPGQRAPAGLDVDDLRSPLLRRHDRRGRRHRVTGRHEWSHVTRRLPGRRRPLLRLPRPDAAPYSLFRRTFDGTTFGPAVRSTRTTTRSGATSPTGLPQRGTTYYRGAPADLLRRALLGDGDGLPRRPALLHAQRFRRSCTTGTSPSTAGSSRGPSPPRAPASATSPGCSSPATTLYVASSSDRRAAADRLRGRAPQRAPPRWSAARRRRPRLARPRHVPRPGRRTRPPTAAFTPSCAGPGLLLRRRRRPTDADGTVPPSRGTSVTAPPAGRRATARTTLRRRRHPHGHAHGHRRRAAPPAADQAVAAARPAGRPGIDLRGCRRAPRPGRSPP